MANFYQILGLPNFASSLDVKKAFRRLAVQYHPDKHKGDKDYEEKFKSINKAYQTLCDPRKKDLYDQRLLYASQPRSTYEEKDTTAQHPRPKSGRAHEPIIKEAKEKRTPRELKHTSLQIKLMKTILVVCVIFMLLGVTAQFYEKKQKPYSELRELENRYIKSSEVSLKKMDLLKAEAYLDTLSIVNKYSTKLNELELQLTDSWKKKVSNNHQNNQGVREAMTELTRICDKYNHNISGKYYMYWAQDLINAGQVENGLFRLKEAKKAGLTLIETCALSNIYLNLNLLDKAEGVIQQTKTKIFQRFYRSYGPGYYEVLKTKEIHPEIVKELVQFAVLNENKPQNKVPSSLLYDFLSVKLKDKPHEEMYDFLLSVNFLKENVTDSDKERFVSSLKYFNLYNYY